MKKVFCVILFSCIVGGVFAQNKSFDWVIALAGDAGGVELTVDKPVQLATGDVFKFLLRSNADCYVYAVAQTSTNEVFVLYSGTAQKDAEISIGPVKVTAPAGTETFFIVASASPQAKLEKAVETQKKTPSSARNARAVLNEVFALRRDVSQLDQKAEQPVFLGGAFRGETAPGLLFSGAETYVRTFNISH